MKKVLLLLWKVLLTSLGGREELQFYFCVQFPFEESAAAAVKSTADQRGWE